MRSQNRNRKVKQFLEEINQDHKLQQKNTSTHESNKLIYRKSKVAPRRKRFQCYASKSDKIAELMNDQLKTNMIESG